MFTPESQERADYIRNVIFGGHPGPFVLMNDGTLGLLVGQHVHTVPGDQNVQIGVSAEESTAAAIKAAQEQDATDLAAYRAEQAAKKAT